MSARFVQQLPHRRERVADWFARPGAVTRLTPGAAPLTPRAAAADLAAGETVFAMPAGLTWRARHDPAAFIPGRRFADEVVNAPWRALTGWRHVHELADSRGPDGAGTVVVDRIRARVPAAALRGLFAFRHATLAGDLAAADRLAGVLGIGAAAGREPGERLPRLTIAVTGASGTVGTALVALLGTAGHEVIRLVRGEAAGPGERRWDPEAPAADLLEGVDALVHLAGAPIAGRFTEAHLAAVRDSRVGPTRRLAEAVAAAGTPVAVSASAVGYYGADRGGEILDEDAAAGPRTEALAGIVADWEDAWAPARAAGARVALLRTGLVLAGGGGLLPPLAGLTRACLGGRLGSGRQWFPWIALDDLVDLYHRAALDPALAGPVNAVAPGGVDNAAFTRTLAEVLRRPVGPPVPAAGPALLLGRRGAAELALADQPAVPARLVSMGHVFRHPGLAGALRHELLRPAPERG